MNINMRVEFDSRPVRHYAVQCPCCQMWFHGSDIGPENQWISYEYQLETAAFTCPICEKEFGGVCRSPFGEKDKINIREVNSSEECYEGCLTQKVIWE